jgi:cytochrome P450
MGHHEPVTDWANDFDHTDDVYAADPYPIWKDIRESGCPIAHTERYGGAWLPTSFKDVSAIAYDTERFTSRSVLATEFRPPMELAPAGIAPPISADPPFHLESRRALLPVFSPKVIAELEKSTRAYCQELIAEMGHKDVVDAALEYSQNIPVRVIANMLGLPESDADKFRGFVTHALEGVSLPLEERMAGMMELFQYMRTQIVDHLENPRDDMISYLLEQAGGDPAAQADLDADTGTFMVGRTVVLLLLAGIDTTWSAIGASLWHLAKTPSDREWLVREPELMPSAIEELLRAYSPVTMARLVREDMDFNGCPMKAEEWVLLPFPAANRDPEAFDRPDEVILDREENRHSAFGLGPHRCAGSHLARMEMRVALEEWLAAFPDFELADPDAVLWSGGQVRGPRLLPIKINR